MGVEGVGRALDLVEGERDAKLGAEPREIVVRRLHPAAIAEFLRHIFGAVETARGNRRVELIGPPAHRDRPRLLRQSRLEPFLADIAPGAYDVADDVDGQNVIRFAHGGPLRFAWLYLVSPKRNRKQPGSLPAFGLTPGVDRLFHLDSLRLRSLQIL